MAGQPMKSPNDAQKYRDAYMANLNLQIKNNDKNLQANKLHQRTGVPVTQISDYRTTSEKLADVETLRALVRSELLQIADSINANAIVQKLSVDELRFVAQNIEMIVKDLKPKHKFGVLQPIFQSYLVLQMNAQMKADANAAGIMLENRGVESLASLKQLESDTVSDRDVSRIFEQLQGEIPFRRELIQAISFVAEKLQILTPQFYKRLESIPDFTERVAALEKVARAIRELPSKKKLTEQIGLINDSDDLEQKERVAELIEMLDVPTLNLLEEVQSEVPHRSTYEDPRLFEKDLSKKRIMEIVAPYVARYTHEDLFGLSTAKFNALRVEDLRRVVRDRIDGLMEIYNSESEVEEPQRPVLSTTNVFQRSTAPPSRVYSEPSQQVRAEVTERKRVQKETEQAAEQAALAKYNELQKKSQAQLTIRKVAQAKSLRTPGSPRRRSALKAARAEERPLEVRVIAEPAVVTQEAEGNGLKFGKYFLHKDKIKDDIVMVRQKNGRNHPMMPTKRVSKGLGIVLRHIAGGANPSYDELHRLTDEDRSHLSDLVRICKVDVSVPEGSDKDDLHQFEILRGELGAGNDSPELIKKLKGVIMRLMNKGRLPKGQGREVLLDLVALGY